MDTTLPEHNDLWAELETPLLLPIVGLEMRVVNDLDDYAATHEEVTEDPTEASVVTSRVAGSPDLHKPVLDIDFPVAVVPSSTPGHGHLYINKHLSWAQYEKLLVALRDAGILEEGYVGASLERGYTSVRLPWVKKSPDADLRSKARCVGCRKRPSQIHEYVELAEREGYSSAEAAVRGEEGTYNRENQHFWCTACYIAAGQPLGVAP